MKKILSISFLCFLVACTPQNEGPQDLGANIDSKKTGQKLIDGGEPTLPETVEALHSSPDGSTYNASPKVTVNQDAKNQSFDSESQLVKNNLDGIVKGDKKQQIALKKKITVDVYKSDSCGCCSSWIKHLEEHGFSVVTHTDNAGDAKNKYGVPPDMRSCHTGVVNGKFIEGHVPAEDIWAFINNPSYSDAKGIAVPGMPIGSPGMEMDGQVEPYNVFLIQADRKDVLARHK